jgi:aminopeptidase-like protein
MANNELSGIAVLTFIAKFISKMRNRKFSYRIVFVPETIGSIAFINKNINNLKKNVYAGFNVTCIGDNRSYSYLPTRNGSTISDEIAKHVLYQKDRNFKKYHWKDRGSDERQYNAPGVDLPIASLMRTKYGEYPEYHTSLDNLEKVVTPEGLQGGYDLVKDCLIILERNYIPKVTTICEPQLGKRKLYPQTGLRGIPKEISLLRDVISYSDGTRSLLNIANICSTSFFKVFEITEKLHKFKLIKKNYI